MTFFFLLNPKHYWDGAGDDPQMGFPARYAEEEVTPRLRTPKKLLRSKERVYSKELEKSLIDYTALMNALDAIQARLDSEILELERQAYLAQQAELKRQKNELAKLILKMEEEEYMLMLLLLNDD